MGCSVCVRAKYRRRDSTRQEGRSTDDDKDSGVGDYELCHDEQGNEYLYSETRGESMWLESGFEFNTERQELRNTITGERKSLVAE